jgi:hypothetical protein
VSATSVTLAHIKLANVATGQAEVRLFTPASRDVTFGTSRSLGWVVRALSGRWIAQDLYGVPLAAFPTRKGAVNYLASQGKAGAL